MNENLTALSIIAASMPPPAFVVLQRRVIETTAHVAVVDAHFGSIDVQYFTATSSVKEKQYSLQQWQKHYQEHQDFPAPVPPAQYIAVSPFIRAIVNSPIMTAVCQGVQIQRTSLGGYCIPTETDQFFDLDALFARVQQQQQSIDIHAYANWSSMLSDNTIGNTYTHHL